MGKTAAGIFLAFFYSILSNAAIYGEDNRKDIHVFGDVIKNTAYAVAVNVPSFFLVPDEEYEGFFKHQYYDDKVYGQKNGLCKEEKFYSQTSFGHCTSFLIHESLMVTAGHCFLPAGKVENELHDYCNNFSFWFGYNSYHNKKLGRKIDPRDIAHCKNVIYAENNESENPIIDFAILELSQPIRHIKPLNLGFDYSRDQKVFALGHPHGLPLKHSGYSKILNEQETSFSANLDTLSGNSGGPVLNSSLDVLGVLVEGHSNDYFDTKICSKINTCSKNGLDCLNPSGIDSSNYMVKSAEWLPFLNAYLKNL